MFKLRHPNLEDVPALRLLWKEAFGDGASFLDAFFSTAFAPARSLVVNAGKEIAAALFWFPCDYAYGQLGYLYGVCTRTAYRGQGLCHLLMTQVEKLLVTQGYVGTILVPGSKALASLYASMGYVPCCPAIERRIDAGQTPLSIEPVTPEKYAALRHGLLPLNGVRQEGINLSFQAKLGGLYRGEHCIFAVEQTADFAIIKELLTDSSHPETLASGLLAALQIKSAVLRRYAKNGTNFAMFHALCACPLPSYFGLAFD